MKRRTFMGLALVMLLVFLAAFSALFVGLFGERMNARGEYQQSDFIIVKIREDGLHFHPRENYTVGQTVFVGLGNCSVDPAVTWDLDRYFIDWGDGATDNDTYNASKALNHTYSQNGFYTIQLYVYDDDNNMYNYDWIRIAVWDRQITFVLQCGNETLDDLQGYVAVVNATDPMLAYWQLQYMAQPVSLATGIPTVTVYCNNGDNYFVPIELYTPRKSSAHVGEIEEYAVQYMRPVTLFRVNATSPPPEDAGVIVNLTRVPYQHEEIFAGCPSVPDVKITYDMILYHQAPYMRFVFDLYLAMLYPDRFDYDGVITDAEADALYNYSNDLLEILEISTEDETTENMFYINNKYLYIDGMEVARITNLTGRYNYSVTELNATNMLKENMTITIDGDLYNDELTVSDKYIVRLFAYQESKSLWNRSYKVSAPESYYIADYDIYLGGYTYFDEGTQTVTYKPQEVLKASDIPEVLEITIEKLPEESEENVTEEEEGAGGVVEEEEAPWYEWFYDNWIWLVIIGGIVVLAYVLLRRP